MKKLLLLSIVALIAFGNMSAQDPIFVKGDKALNLGVGIGSTLYTGTYFKGQIPPISASLEVGILDNLLEKGSLGIGGYVGYSSYKYTVIDWGWKYSNIIIGPRGSFHYPLLKNLDTYTGLLLGYNIVTSKEFGTIETGVTASGSGIVWSWYAGARYYFKDKFGLMAELGYGIAYLNLGITLKL
jgi:hypothetical protein